MTKEQHQYYKDMADLGRLIPIMKDDKLVGLMTYYIGNNDDKFIRNNPWTVLHDDPETGKTVYIDQLICKDSVNRRGSLRIWNYLKNHFKQTYPQIRQIKWAHKGRVKRYAYTKSTN